MKRIALIGPDTAGLILRTRDALCSAGYRVTTVCLHPEAYSETPKYSVRVPFPDNMPKEMIASSLFPLLLGTHQVFVYISRYTLLAGHRDYQWLKKCGKRVMLITCGCDTRHWSQHIPWASANNVSSPCHSCPGRISGCATRQKKALAHKASRYADVIFSNPDSAGFLPDIYQTFFAPLSLSQYPYHWEPPTAPLIVHCPSHAEKKGTTAITKALETLRGDGFRFDYRLLQNLPNQEVLCHLRQSHIVIDQLHLSAYGTFALEAMASGNVVISSARNDLSRKPMPQPTVLATPDTIYKVLKDTLSCPEEWQTIASAGRRYVETYHDHKVVGRYLSQFVEGGV